MDPFTLTWNVRDEHCGQVAVSDALEAVDVRFTGDPAEDEAAWCVEQALADCPPDSATAAASHLRRVSVTSDAAYDMLREAVDQLDTHGRYCSCVRRAWDDFADELSALLLALPDSRYLVDDMAHRRVLPDKPRQVASDDVRVWKASAGVHPDALEVHWTGQVLIVKAAVGRDRHEVHFEPLTEPYSSVAWLLENDASHGDDSTPAHAAYEYDRDVCEAVVDVTGDQARSASSRGWSDTRALLSALAAFKDTSPPPLWQTLCRIADGWAGTLEELKSSAAAVVTPRC